MSDNKKVFKRALLGLQREDVESYILELKNRLEMKDSKIGEMERTIRYLEREKHDLIKQLNILKEIFSEQNELTSE